MEGIINVTEITDYLYCPRKVFLKRVKGLKEKPNRVMILGFLKHKIFDFLNKREPSTISGIKTNLKKEEIINLYVQEIKNISQEIFSSNFELAKSFDIGREELENQASEFLKKDILLRAQTIKKGLEKGYIGKELWENLNPKYFTEFKITSEKLKLRGRIDRVLISEKIIPYEIKTREGVYDSDKIQLAAYSLLLEDKFKREVKIGFVETNKKNHEILITKEMKARVLEIAEKIRQMKDANFQNNFNKCRFCKFKEECFDL